MLARKRLALPGLLRISRRAMCLDCRQLASFWQTALCWPRMAWIRKTYCETGRSKGRAEGADGCRVRSLSGSQDRNEGNRDSSLGAEGRRGNGRALCASPHLEGRQGDAVHRIGSGARLLSAMKPKRKVVLMIVGTSMIRAQYGYPCFYCGAKLKACRKNKCCGRCKGMRSHD
jgi:hypothetical protein